jgi:hypothetical protein
MQLRAAGVSYEKIAKAIGYCDRSAARKAVFAGIRADKTESCNALRQLELIRLDRLWMAMWPLAIAQEPDMNATDRCLKILARRAALMGLDAADQPRERPPVNLEVQEVVVRNRIEASEYLRLKQAGQI